MVPALILAEDEPRRDVDWLAEVQTPPADIGPKTATELSTILRDANGDQVTTVDGWRKRGGELRKWWSDYLGTISEDRKQVPTIEVIEEDRVEGVIRQRVRYEVEAGIFTEAYLLRPTEMTGRAPGVVVLHSTIDHSIRQPAGVEGKPEKFFGLNLAKAGCVTICPRNYLWPTNDKIAAKQEAERFHERRPGITGMAKMLHDAQVAVDILAARDDVDPKRLGCVGHSLGAKEVLYLAAFDERIKVTVSSEGGIGTTFSNWEAPWYLGDRIQKEDFTHEHHELLALIAPRPFLLIGGDSADGDRSWPFINAALPVYRLYGEPARLGLFNHKQGHAVPPKAEQRIQEWLLMYL